jgi:hypothetical protein
MVVKWPMVTFLTQLLLAVRSWFAGRARLEAENLLQRQQLIVLRRRHPKRVRLLNIDRLLCRCQRITISGFMMIIASTVSAPTGAASPATSAVVHGLIPRFER